MANNVDFWNALLSHGDAIAAIDPDSREAKQELLAHLETIIEAFGRTFDPVDCFEEYVATSLCQSIQGVLSRMD